MSNDNHNPTPLPSGSLVPSDLLLREVTALARAEFRRHSAANLSATVTLDELVSEGWLAAQRALENYDPLKGLPLPYIRVTVKDRLQDFVRTTKVGPVGVSARTIKSLQAGTLDSGSAATLTAFSRRASIQPGAMGFDSDGLAEASAGVIFEGDVQKESAADVESSILAAESREMVRTFIDRLASVNATNAQVICLRFGFTEGGVSHSVDEVALILGTSPKNVERRYTAAMKSLRIIAGANA